MGNKINIMESLLFVHYGSILLIYSLRVFIRSNKVQTDNKRKHKKGGKTMCTLNSDNNKTIFTAFCKSEVVTSAKGKMVLIFSICRLKNNVIYHKNGQKYGVALDNGWIGNNP